MLERSDYCLDGQRLIYQAEANAAWAGGTVYRYKTERDTFARIEFDPFYPGAWQIQTGTGRTWKYGGANPVSFSSGAISDGGTAWAGWGANKLTDQFGNEMRVSYWSWPNGVWNAGVVMERYPRTIDYGLNTVDFEYEELGELDQRLEAPFGFEDFGPGGADDTYDGEPGFNRALVVKRRLTRVVVKHSSQPIFEYELKYEKSPVTERNRVTGILECAYDGKKRVCKPQVDFVYGDPVGGEDQFGTQPKDILPTPDDFTVNFRQSGFRAIQADDQPGDELLFARKASIDDESPRLYVIHRAGNFTPVQQATDLYAGAFDVMDWNEDGRDDILHVVDVGSGHKGLGVVFSKRLEGSPQGVDYGYDPVHDGYDVEVARLDNSVDHYGWKLVDLNGDGRKDLLTCEELNSEQIAGKYYIRFWNPTSGFGLPLITEFGCRSVRKVGWTFPIPIFIDVTGDGAPEWIWKDGGDAQETWGLPAGIYTLSRPGSARLYTLYRKLYRHDRDDNPYTAYDLNDGIPNADQPVNIFKTMDVNGDGLVDLIHFTGGSWSERKKNDYVTGKILTYLNSGNGLRAPYESSPVGFVATHAHMVAAIPVDWNEDGKADLLIPHGEKGAALPTEADPWSRPLTWDILISDGLNFYRQDTDIPFWISQSGDPIRIPMASALCATGFVCPGSGAVPFRFLPVSTVDVRGDGHLDLVYAAHGEDETGVEPDDDEHQSRYVLRQRVGPQADLIREIWEQSTSAEASIRPIQIGYGLANQPALHEQDEACVLGNELGCPPSGCVNGSFRPSTYPRACVRDPIPIVAAYARTKGIGAPVDEIEVEGYMGGFTDRLGRGFLGFRRHWWWSDTRNTTRLADFDNVTRNATYGYYPYLGMKVADAIGWGTDYPFVAFDTRPYQETTMRMLSTQEDGSGVFWPAVQVETRILERQAAVVETSNTPVYKVESSFDYDDYGVPNRVAIVSKIGSRWRECGGQNPCIPTGPAGIDESNLDSVVTMRATAAYPTASTYAFGLPVFEVTVGCVPKLDAVGICTAQFSSCSVNGSDFQDCAEKTTAHTHDGIVLTDSYLDPFTAAQVRVHFERDGRGHVTEVTTSGAGSSVGSTKIVSREYVYDSDLVFPDALIDEAGGRHELAFDPRHGTLIGHTDPNAVTALWSYDGFGRVAEAQTSRHGFHATYEWSDDSEYPSYVASVDGGARQEREFDYRGRVVREVAAGLYGKSIVTDYVYNAEGLPWKVSLPHEDSTAALYDVFTYDDRGRVTDIAHADGEATSVAYDPRHVTVTDRRNVEKRSEVDATGRVTRIIEDRGGDDETRTVYEYGPFGALRKITDDDGNETLMERDAYGRITRLDDPSLGAITYEHNAVGEMELQTWLATGATVQRKYDDMGRLVERSDADGTTKWTFDTRPNGHGLLAGSTSADGRTKKRYFYDTNARLDRVETEIDGDVYSVEVQSRDSLSNIERLALPDGPDGQQIELSYDYDDHGNLIKINRQELAVHIPVWEALETDDPILLRKEKFGNNAVTIRTAYADTLLAHTLETARSGDTFQALEFAYDEGGNMRARTNTAIAGVASRSERFQYDGLSRLRHSYIQDGSGPHRDPIDIEYDAVGNITHKSDVGNYGYGSTAHAVMSAGPDMPNGYFAYDEYGNQTKRGDFVLEYNAFNAIAAMYDDTIGSSSATHYAYDANQERVFKDGLSEEVFYVDDVFERHVPKNGDPAEHRYLVNNGARVVAAISVPAGGSVSTKYFHDDHLGSTVAVSDSNGDVVAYSYDAFGARRDDDWRGSASGSLGSAASAGFTGHEHDETEALGIINMRARLYDPKLGRFLSADPLATSTSQGLNRYSYVDNQPLKLVDPTGLQEVPSFGATARVQPPIISLELTLSRGFPIQVITPFTSQSLSGAVGRYRDELSFPTTIAPPAPSSLDGLGNGPDPQDQPPPKPTQTAPDPLAERSDAGLTVDDALEIGGVVGRAVAEMVVPGLGEVSDAMTLADPEASGFEKTVAGISLGIGAWTLGASPNVSPLLRGFKNIRKILSRGEREAAHALRTSRASPSSIQKGVPEGTAKLYHYTDEARAGLIERSQLGLPGGTTYMTPAGGLSPTQAGIELALPQTNTAEAVFEISVGALDASKVSRVGRITGNVFGRGGGGVEVLYEGTVPLSAVKRIR